MNLIYLICKSHIFETRLLPMELIKGFMKLDRLEEFVKEISQTGYAPRLKDAKNIWDIERALAGELMDRFQKLLKIAPEGVVGSFLTNYLRKYELQNVVWIVRMKSRNVSEKEIERLFFPVEGMGFLDPKPLISAKTLEEVLLLLSKSGYPGIEAFVEADIPLIEAMLKKIHYRRLLKHASRLILKDRREIMDLIVPEIDLENLKLALTAIARKYKEEDVGDLFIKSSSGIHPSRFLALIREGDPQKSVKLFPEYGPFLEAILSGDEWRAELERLRIVKRKLWAKRIEKYVSFFYVMKYIVDAEIEYRNLRSIAIAIYHRMPVEAREELLISE